MPYVVVVDDETDSRDALVQYLEKMGHHTDSAPNGRDALELVINTTPDVVVLDWMMPEMDGIGFLKVLRSYLRLRNIPVILVTAFRGPHIDAARELGVRDVFLKANFRFDELAEAIERICGPGVGTVGRGLIPPPKCDGGGIPPS
jgi:CheY-like chemotaxis protein